MDLLGFQKYNIITSANKDNLASSFPIWLPFIFFSCLIALARTSSTILNNSGENGHPCHVADHKGKASSFSPFIVKVAVHLSYMACIVLRYILLQPIFEGIYREVMFNFMNCFFSIS
uniref:Uncharacterized protein n=1 Tax=Macaca fascicularis TaxID=9541 RepID=A0A7N9IDP8_MACFA